MVTLVSFLQCVCGRRRRIGDVIEQPYQEDNSTHTYIMRFQNLGGECALPGP